MGESMTGLYVQDMGHAGMLKCWGNHCRGGCSMMADQKSVNLCKNSAKLSNNRGKALFPKRIGTFELRNMDPKRNPKFYEIGTQ